jgi:hypothetical protein
MAMFGHGRNAGSASIKTNASRGASLHLNNGSAIWQKRDREEGMEYPTAYLDDCALRDDPKGPLFRTIPHRGGQFTRTPSAPKPTPAPSLDRGQGLNFTDERKPKKGIPR